MPGDLLQLTENGLHCPAGDFYVDPWRPVPRAILTHAHADHARPGSQNYLAAIDGLHVLRARLGREAVIQTLPYGETLRLNDVAVSLHPAGHILGSAQVRIERAGEVWVVSGDYKVEPDPTCVPFAPVRCHVFITESTFGLPLYQWPKQAEVLTDINTWWRGNRAEGLTSLLLGYSLGKAQRALAGIDASIGPIYAHGAVMKLNEAYRASGVDLPKVEYAASKGVEPGALIVAPPSAGGTPWARKFGASLTAFLSGWMLVRGARRRRGVDRGFVLSDHADWPGLVDAIRATGAERVIVTHGYAAVLARYFADLGLQTSVLQTQFEGEREGENEVFTDEEAPA